MNGNHLPDIRETSGEELLNFFLKHREKGFRGVQAYSWLWKKSCTSFEAMTSLPKTLHHLMAEHFTFHIAQPEIKRISKDGTIKVGFRLFDGLMVEGVLIPGDGRYTACISSQAGCALGCLFCATGKQGFHRNLSYGEIFDQVVYLSKLAEENPLPGKNLKSRALSNIVYMGMGEPFMNYDNVVKSIEKLTYEEGMGMSPQRITVSSIGIPKMIRQMADDDPKYHFALSLHAASDHKRNQLIPFSFKHPLSMLTDALKYYYAKTKKRFTIEYILFGGVNDSLEDAQELAIFCKSFPVKINIIEYNPVNNSGFRGTEPEKIKAFAGFLEKKNLVVNIRRSRGKDIEAACGQLSANQ